MDMRAGYLYIMQYPGVKHVKTGRAVNARNRLKNNAKGTKLHLTVVTSDMRAAEAAMLASLRSAEAAAEGVEDLRGEGLGNETFRGPFLTIARRVTEAARLFPAAPHNLMSAEAAREWYARERAAGNVAEGVSVRQFLIDNKCLTDLRRDRAVRVVRRAPLLRSLRRRTAQKRRAAQMDEGTPEEKQMAYEHGMAVERYAVDEALCDVHFFDRYIGTLADSARMVRQFYALQRFHTALRLTTAELEAAARDARGEEHVRAFFEPAARAAALLDRLSPGWQEHVHAGRRPAELRLRATVGAVAEWAGEMTDEQYDRIGVACTNARDAASSRSKLAEALAGGAGGDNGKSKNVTKTATQTANRVLRSVFGVTLGDRRGRIPRCDVDTSAYEALLVYKCGCLAADASRPATGFAWVEGDSVV